MNKITVGGQTVEGTRCSACGTLIFPSSAMENHEAWHRGIYSPNSEGQWGTSKKSGKKRHTGGRKRLKESEKAQPIGINIRQKGTKK